MPRGNRRWTLLIAWIALTLPAAAQRFSFKLYGPEHGLTNLAVHTLLQDRAGFMWVGTQNGLFRYDGRSFQRFGRIDGLPSSRIESLHESGDGILWIATRSGIARWRGGVLESVPLGRPVEISGRSTIASDTAGRLLVATSAGLLIADKVETGFRVVPVSAKAAYASSSIRSEKSGVIWFGCGDAVCRLDPDRSDALIEPGIPADRWDAMITDRDGTLWLRSSRRLLARARGRSEFTPFDDVPDSSEFGTLMLSRDGELFVPTDRGVAIRSSSGWRMVSAKAGLPSDATSALIQDRESSIWIGSLGVGVARWLGYREWDSWTSSEGLASDIVWEMRPDDAGNLWVGTDNGISRMDASGSWKRWSTTEGLGGNRVRAVTMAPDGSIWAGSSPGGVSRLDPGGSRFRRIGKASDLLNARVTHLTFDSAGRLWVSTRGDLYLCSTPLITPRCETVRLPGGGTGELFFQTLEDRSGRFWVSGSRGLARLENGQWRRYTTADGLKTNYIGYLAEGLDNSLWVGYREANGLSRLSTSKDGFEIAHFSQREGLHSDQALFVGVDAGGRVWYGSDQGVDVFDGTSWRHYGHENGLIWDDCDGNAFWPNTDGSVWIGTSRGLSRYRPAKDQGAPSPPRVEWTSLRGGDQFFPAATAAIRLPFTERNFHARFAVLTYLHEESTIVRYRMRGLEEEWIETTQREVRYPNLPVGTFTLEVSARSSAGWSEQPAAVEVEVLPAWWAAWWFRAASSCGIAGLVWLGMSWRLRQFRSRQAELETVVAARTRELREQQAHTEQEKDTVERQKEEIERLLNHARAASRLKSEFLANVSHEIRTPLNGLLGMTSLALSTELDPEQRDYLETARVSGDCLLTLINDILDFSKIEAGRLELEQVPFSPAGLLAESVKTLAIEAFKKGIGLTLATSPDLPALLMGDPVRLRQVFLNLIGNAVKFTAKGGVHVTADVENLMDHAVRVRFAVRDTGIGIPPEKCASIFEPFRQADGSTTRRYGGTGLGLAICERLVTLMGSRIQVESALGSGSTFHFSVQMAVANPVHTTPGAVPAFSIAPIRRAERALRILLAEDAPINQKLAVRLLEKRGHSVALANNGAEVLLALDTGSFDLILMDLQMPVMDGLQATTLIRQRERATGNRIPIVALTADASAGDRHKCLASGMDGYVAKPIRIEELFTAIEHATGSLVSSN